jgi:hypothetical protein
MPAARTRVFASVKKECSTMRGIVFAMVAGLLVVSCGSKDEAPNSTTANGMEFSTGEFEIPAGDSFECFYTNTFTPRDIGVTGAVGRQMTGGHHITVYYTDLKRPAEHHECSDAEMVQWHMIAGADELGTAADGELRFQMPAGYAYKVPANKQIVLQVHYINTTGKPRKVSDSVTLNTIEVPQVKTWANHFLSSHEAWTIPPKNTQESSSTCTVNADINAFLLTGHMHEWGRHYKLERLDDAGNSAETLLDHDWEPSYSSHPPLKQWATDKPLVIKKGTKLRQTCKWENDTDTEIIFPREMCVFFGYYYPDQGEITCEKN